MLGFFKKKISPQEFGATAAQWSNEFLVNDAALSLARLFDDFWDKDRPDKGEEFLARHAIPAPKQNLYIRLFAHCAVHAASTDSARKSAKQ